MPAPATTARKMSDALTPPSDDWCVKSSTRPPTASDSPNSRSPTPTSESPTSCGRASCASRVARWISDESGCASAVAGAASSATGCATIAPESVSNGSSASSSAVIDWKRSSALRAIARSITTSSASGMSGAIERGRGGDCVSTAVSAAAVSSASNGVRPASRR